MSPVEEQQKVISQWIISLGVSVVCCATLFIVFAVYIMNVSDKATLANLRLEILQERQHQIVADIDYIRRTMVQRQQPVMAMPQYQTGQPEPMPAPPVGETPYGMQPSQPAHPAAPMALPEVAPPSMAPPPAAAPMPAQPNVSPQQPAPTKKPLSTEPMSIQLPEKAPKE